MAVGWDLNVRLSRLIEGMPISPGESDLEVMDLTHDSRQVKAGDLYVALEGERFDGRRFAADAAARGAVAALGAGSRPRGYDGPWLAAEEPRALMGPLAARLHGHPDRELVTVGITGTNGKSTTAALVTAVLEAAGRPTGTLGTLGYTFRGRRFDGERTTPEASDLFRTLRAIRDAGGEAAVLEVSSIGLSQFRVHGLALDLAIFTNLTRDHLDFHGTLEQYFAAKRTMFSQLKPGGLAVVNLDDAHGARLARELDRVMGFGAGGAVEVIGSSLGLEGTRATFATPRGPLEARSPLVGRHNLENLSAAVAAGEALGLEHQAIAGGIAACPPLPGRMEPVQAGQDFPVFVDFAHTPGALEAVLTALRELGERKVALVFGCGGDRDPGKRGVMGEVAGRLADLPIVTSDNPRSEDPLAIIGAVEEGLKRSGNTNYRVVPDRREAIRRAVGRGGAGWCVVVAGKGHEETQWIGQERLPFSDRAEIVAALEERLGTGHPG